MKKLIDILFVLFLAVFVITGIVNTISLKQAVNNNRTFIKVIYSDIHDIADSVQTRAVTDLCRMNLDYKVDDEVSAACIRRVKGMLDVKRTFD